MWGSWQAGYPIGSARDHASRSAATDRGSSRARWAASGTAADSLTVAANVPVLAAHGHDDCVVLAGVAHPPMGARVDPRHPTGAQQVPGAVAEPELDFSPVDEVSLLLLLVEVNAGLVSRRQHDRVDSEGSNTDLVPDLSEAVTVPHFVYVRNAITVALRFSGGCHERAY